MLPLLLAIVAAVCASRNRAAGRLHPAAAVALALIASAALGVVVLAAAAGVLLAGLLSLVAAAVLPDSGPADPVAGVLVALTDPMVTWALAGLVALGATVYRFGHRQDDTAAA